jgi:hypothetical protein
VPWSDFPVNPATGVVTQMQHFEFAIKACPFPIVRGLTDEYQERVRTIMRAAQEGEAQQFPFEAFDSPRVFTVPAGRQATGRSAPTRGAARVKDFPAGTAIECDGVFRGEPVDGDDRWLRTSDPQHLAIHASGLVESEPGRRDGVPIGPIKTLQPRGVNPPAPFGVDWEQINRWDEAIRAAAAEFDAPAARVKAHIVIESQGIPGAIQENPSNGGSFGLMQVVPRFHRALILRLANRDGAGLDDRAVGRFMTDDPTLAVRAGTGVLRAMFDRPEARGDWSRASSMFFLGNPDFVGQDTVNGNTGTQYRDALNGLIAEQALGEQDPGGGDLPPVPFEPFAESRVFHVRQGVRATGRARPTLAAPIVQEFAAGTAIRCDGVLRGEAVEGDDRWLRTSGNKHLAIHASGLAEPI